MYLANILAELLDPISEYRSQEWNRPVKQEKTGIQ
jgi:hypothetical protein